MLFKILGAFTVICVCGGCGLALAHEERTDILQLQNTLQVLNYMECELQYHATPLPELLRLCADESGGAVSEVFRDFASSLSLYKYSSAAECMRDILQKNRSIPKYTKMVLIQLGAQLGHFDLSGQVQHLTTVKELCSSILVKLCNEKRLHIRHYKTIGLSVGAALVILLI